MEIVLLFDVTVAKEMKPFIGGTKEYPFCIKFFLNNWSINKKVNLGNDFWTYRSHVTATEKDYP